MNNINNIKLSKVSYKILENDQNRKRIAKVDLANKNYSKNLVFGFFAQKLDILLRSLLNCYSIHIKRERERERAKVILNLPGGSQKFFFYLLFDVLWQSF